MKPILKICNIQNIYEARSAGELGIPYIGLHAVSATDYANLETLKRIVVMIHEEFPNTKTILVTKEKNTETLMRLIDEVECDGVQLHYKAQAKQLVLLKSRYGQRFIIFCVVTEEDQPYGTASFEKADFIILDKSYVGGTGKQVSPLSREKIINKYGADRLILAGGIDANYLRKVAPGISVAGFDIQSGVRSAKRTDFENIEYDKLKEIAQLFNYSSTQTQLPAIGFSVLSDDNIKDYYNIVDFWHFDFFDNILGQNSNLPSKLESVKDFITKNTHFSIQIHIFSKSKSYIADVYHSLSELKTKSVRFFIHINPELQPEINFDYNLNIYPAIDVRDVIDDVIPLEDLLKSKKLLLCLQSEKHKERAVNAAIAIKLLKAMKPTIEITLDRSIAPSDLNYVDAQIDSIVSGKYIREYKLHGYYALKKGVRHELKQGSSSGY